MPADIYLNVAVSGILTGLIYGLSALGLSVIFGVIRIVNFAHGEIMVVGMFLTLALFRHFGIDPLLSLPLVAAVLFGFGYAMQDWVVRRVAHLADHLQFLLMAAVAVILTSACLMLFGPDAQGAQVGYAYDSFKFGPLIVDKVRLYAGVAALVVAGALFAFFRYTGTGKAIRACGDNYLGAQVVGLNVRHLFALTFGIGAACLGAAGAILLLLIDVHPYLGPPLTLLAFIIVIVGGMGSLPGAMLGGVLIGASEALAGLILQPSLKSAFSFGLLILVLLVRPQGLLGEGGAMKRLTEGVPPRALVLLCVLAIALAVAPLFVSGYLLSVLIIVLYFAYVGQAWNLMLGFAGLLSLGHALFVGIGAYASAALFVHFGIGPWIGMVVAVALSVLTGCIIGYLGFRFSIGGVYFALLTIAFAEFTLVIVDHVPWLGSTGGLFLPVANRSRIDLINLRGSQVMFYYVILALTGGALVLCRLLLNSKLGLYWQAIREDQQSAEAVGVHLFRYKMIAVAISSGLTGIAGVWYAFYYNNLFPETTFSTAKSIELILGTVVGGAGTLFGPILGAFILTPLGEVLTALTEGMKIDGIKQFFWGICVAAIVLFRPTGVWPWLSALLGLDGRRPGDGR